MAAAANVAALEQREGKAGKDGDAVIALLAGHRDMRKAERPELKLWELAFDAFDLLQANHIRPVRSGEAADEIELEPDRVDVPRGETEAHGLAKIECGAGKSKRAGARYPRNAPSRGPKMKKPRRRGTRGFSGSLLGGTCDGEGTPSQKRHITYRRQLRCLFAASEILTAAKSPARPARRVRSNSQKKGAQPLRVVGRQKRVVFARVPGGKPARANHIFG